MKPIPIRKLFVTCDYPPILGGQSNYFKNLWQELDPEKDRLLLPECCKPFCRSAHLSHVRFVRVPFGKTGLARLGRVVALFFALLGQCLTFRPAEIHAGQILSAGLCCCLLRPLFGFRYVLYIFGADVMEFTRFRLLRGLIFGILRHSRLIIACSRFTAGYLRERYPRAPAAVVVNPGVEARFFTDRSQPGDVRSVAQQLKGRKILLTVGRLVARKGHDTVLRALPMIAKDVPGVHYLIVGDGPNRACLQRLSEAMGVSDRVSFCGAVSDADLPAYYRLADVFIMVSRRVESRGDVEGFGIVYLEANAAGLPAIAADGCGAVDAISDGVNGLLVRDAESPAEVAQSAVRLLTSPDLAAELAKAAMASALASNWTRRRTEWRNALGTQP
jgi:phosphatidylinositol alpha-1,6-mannosyltransferase